MTEHHIIVPGEIPGMNEIIAAAKDHFGAYAAMKKAHTESVAWEAKSARVPAIQRATVHCHWVVRNRRRDPDNIQAAVKFVLDGLVKAGVLPGDGWRHIAGIRHTFDVDKHNPRVEIRITEAKDVAS